MREQRLPDSDRVCHVCASVEKTASKRESLDIADALFKGVVVALSDDSADLAKLFFATLLRAIGRHT